MPMIENEDSYYYDFYGLEERVSNIETQISELVSEQSEQFSELMSVQSEQISEIVSLISDNTVNTDNTVRSAGYLRKNLRNYRKG